MGEYVKASRPVVSRINRSTFHSAVLCAALFLTATISPTYYSIIFLFLLICYLYLFNGKLSLVASRILRPIILMILLGAIFSFENNVYEAFKDIWYGSKAIICFLLGYHIAKKISDTNQFFNLFVRLAFLLALIYLTRIILSAGVGRFETVSGIGGLPLFISLAVPLLLFRKNGFIFKGNSYFRVMIVIAVVASFALSFSRTSIGCLFIVVFAGAGFFERIRKFIVYFALVVTAMGFLISITPNLDAQELTFLGKVKNSAAEVLFVDDTDAEKMLINWRGFEAYRAYLAFVNATIPQQIFGRGWGATVDLGLMVQMSDDMTYQYLPLLHNGYLHILTKYGITGIILYFLFIWNLVIASKRNLIKTSGVRYSRIVTGLGLVVVYTSLVITGILNKGALDSTLIVLGLCFGLTSLKLKPSPTSAVSRLSRSKINASTER